MVVVSCSTGYVMLSLYFKHISTPVTNGVFNYGIKRNTGRDEKNKYRYELPQDAG